MSERTLAVLFGPEGVALRADIEPRILDAGFTIVAQALVVGEELEESGLDLGLQSESGAFTENDSEHVVFVLAKVGAVQAWREMIGEGAGVRNKNSLAAIHPSLKLHGSPSESAASMSIASLFPNIDSLSPNSSEARPSGASNASSPASRANPLFALSNLAHAPPPQSNRQDISPSVERALQRLEQQEEHQKRLSDGSITEEQIRDEGNRRVFTYRSNDNTLEFSADGTATYQDEFGDEVSEDLDGEDEEEILEQALEDELAEDEEVEYALRPAPTRQSSTTSSTSSPFKARPLPATHSNPTSQPRLTKAAALRLGITLPPRTPREERTRSEGSEEGTPTPSTTSSSFNFGATPRAGPLPKSLAAPTIVPRGTKASQLRAGADDANATPVAPKPRRQTLSTAERSAMTTFDNTPGHRRRQSLQVASTSRPKIEPRMSRGALLRAGLDPDVVAPKLSRQNSRASSVSSNSEAEPKARRESIAVKSTAPPLVAPRQTKASALRTGVALESPVMMRGKSVGTLEDLVEGEEGAPPMVRAMTTGTFEGVAGHKRRESIQVASTARPTVEPRLSRAAMLRAGITPPESPAARRASLQLNATPSGFEGVPSHRRRESIQVPSSRPPTIAPRLNKSTLLRNGGSADVVAPSPTVTRRPASVLGTTTPATRASSSLSASSGAVKATASVKAPTIAPRTNKSAELRAAKKEAEMLALAKAQGVATAKVARRPASALDHLKISTRTGSPRGTSPRSANFSHRAESALDETF